MANLIPILIILLLSVVGVLADYFIKISGNGVKYMEYRPFLLGMFLYALTSFGWFYVMKHVKLSTLGVFYSVTTLILLVFVGVFFFKEELSVYEIIGISLGVISIFILARFG
ncbi:MAG TPA: hypothetical protein VFQ59_02845 [Candidatus Paceibacterota bacterium]|nr:hypothetical protein [Candidatus Paceibacterota bacterium]